MAVVVMAAAVAGPMTVVVPVVPVVAVVGVAAARDGGVSVWAWA
ncbi:MAG: hypothetical protein P4L96_17875 [Rhodoferax sp.]|nr:hypothetical protein [Rhodoferax sp.]